MKKFNYKILKIMAFSVVMLFMSSSVFAQVQENQQDTTAQDTTTQMNEQQQTMPQEQNQRTGDDMQSQHPDEGVEYSETIDKGELPQGVNSSIDELYPAHEISEVYRGDDDSYKIKVKNEDDEAVIYYDSEGQFLRAENLSGLQQEGALPQEQGQRTEESQEIDADDSQYQPGTMQDQQGSGAEDAEMQEDHDQGMMNESSAIPQEQNQQTDDLRSQDHDKGVNYSETIQESDLSQEINNSLDELYPAHEIEEAYRGDDDSYKVKVKNEDDKAVVYYDSEGGFLRAQNLSDMQQEASPQDQSQRTREMEDQDQWGTDKQSSQQHQQNQGESEADSRQQDAAYSQDQSQRIGDDMGSDTYAEEMQFSEKIDKSELPDAVTNSIDQMYPDNEISEVHKSEDNKYKVKLDLQDDESVVYFDENGEFLRVTQGNQFQGTSPQEQNQRIQDVEESQDDLENQNNNTGTQQDQSGIGAENKSGTWGTDDVNIRDNTWSDDAPGTQQGTTEAWGDTLQNEGSAYPQEQNQRTQENDTWGTQGETNIDSDWESEDTTQTQWQNETIQGDTTETDQGTAAPQEQFQRGTDDVDYSEEIQENDLPESVTSSLEALYPQHEIEEAYRGDDGSYKVKLKNDDDEVAVYYDSEGLFYRDEMLNNMLNEENEDTNQDW